MPRNEGFLDPDAGPLASFASDLRALREKAGKVPYRVLAKRAGFCASTLSVAASGAKLPSLDVTLAYVQVCGGEPEEWRERWHALEAQLQPAQPAPDPHTHANTHTHSGLQFAPPYDADESEPAPIDAVPADNASTPTPAPTPGSESESETETEFETAAPVTLTVSGRLSGRPGTRRSRLPMMSVGRVITAALTLTTAVLGLKVMTSADAGSAPATSPPPAASTSAADTAMQQADALYTLIYQYTPFRSDTDLAIWDVGGCRNLSNAQSKLRDLARKRQEQVEQLAALKVSKVPDHDQLAAALKHAWITSAQTDTAYANIAADLQTGCTSGAIKTDPNYQQADAYAQAAVAAKNEAARLWNSNADELGQLHISEPEL
jgi:helix-turn-helix protein